MNTDGQTKALKNQKTSHPENKNLTPAIVIAKANRTTKNINT